MYMCIHTHTLYVLYVCIMYPISLTLRNTFV